MPTAGRRESGITPSCRSRPRDADLFFGDPDTRFTELVGLLLDTVARLQAGGSRIVIQ
jgi:hypothetical protein